MAVIGWVSRFARTRSRAGSELPTATSQRRSHPCTATASPLGGTVVWSVTMPTTTKGRLAGTASAGSGAGVPESSSTSTAPVRSGATAPRSSSRKAAASRCSRIARRYPAPSMSDDAPVEREAHGARGRRARGRRALGRQRCHGAHRDIGPAPRPAGRPRHRPRRIRPAVPRSRRPGALGGAGGADGAVAPRHHELRGVVPDPARPRGVAGGVDAAGRGPRIGAGLARARRAAPDDSRDLVRRVRQRWGPAIRPSWSSGR